MSKEKTLGDTVSMDKGDLAKLLEGWRGDKYRCDCCGNYFTDKEGKWIDNLFLCNKHQQLAREE